MTPANDPLYVLTKQGARLPALPHGTSHIIHTAAEARDAFGLSHRARWLAQDASVVIDLAEMLRPSETWHRLLVMRPTTKPRRDFLGTLFRSIVAPDDGARLLPTEALIAALSAPNAADLFIGGIADLADKRLILYRGSLDALVVPLAWFKPRPSGPRPDPKRFSVTDYGQTVRLGKYEAAADAILYEFDPQARARMKARQIAKDDSLGGSIRRLRLARGVARDEFPGITEKTVARIERGDVDRPQVATLAGIAQRLGVTVDELKVY